MATGLLAPLQALQFSRKPAKDQGSLHKAQGTAKLENRLPGGLEKAQAPLWPLILKRLEFLAEQEDLGAVSRQLFLNCGQDAQPPLT